jgi:hypothetical protein
LIEKNPKWMKFKKKTILKMMSNKISSNEKNNDQI